MGSRGGGAKRDITQWDPGVGGAKRRSTQSAPEEGGAIGGHQSHPPIASTNRGASALASQLDASSRPLLVLAPNEDLRPAHFQ